MKNVTLEEKKIEEVAKAHCLYDRNICEEDDRLCNLSEQMFILGAKSDAAKDYHTKGMYTFEEIIDFFDKYKGCMSAMILKNEFTEIHAINKVF